MDNLVLQLSGESSHASSPRSTNGSSYSCHLIPLLSTPVGDISSCSSRTNASPVPANLPGINSSPVGASASNVCSKPQDTTIPDGKIDTSTILNGVVAYVDVRTESDNRSRAIEAILRQLGARVSAKLSNDVTHVVYKDGKKRTQDVAVKRGLHFVSVLWLVRCKETGTRACEKDFPVIQPQNTTPLPYGRLKRYRSMQPKSLDEVEADSEKKVRRRAKAKEQQNLQTPTSPKPPSFFLRYLVEDTQKRVDKLGFGSDTDSESDSSLTVPDTPPSLRKRLFGRRHNISLMDSPSCNSREVGNAIPEDVEVCDTPPAVHSPTKRAETQDPCCLMPQSNVTPVKVASSLLSSASYRQAKQTPVKDISQLHPIMHLSQNTVTSEVDRIVPGIDHSLSTNNNYKNDNSENDVSPQIDIIPSIQPVLQEAGKTSKNSPNVIKRKSLGHRTIVRGSPAIVLQSRSLKRCNSPSLDEEITPGSKKLKINAGTAVASKAESLKRCSSPSLDEEITPSSKKLKMCGISGLSPPSVSPSRIKLIPLSQLSSSQTSKQNITSDLHLGEKEVVQLTDVNSMDQSAPCLSRQSLSSSPTLSQETANVSVDLRKDVQRRKTQRRCSKLKSGVGNESVNCSAKPSKCHLDHRNSDVTVVDKANNYTPNTIASPVKGCIDSLVLETRVKRRRSKVNNNCTTKGSCSDSAESVEDTDSDSCCSSVRRSFPNGTKKVTPSDALLPKLPISWENPSPKPAVKRSSVSGVGAFSPNDRARELNSKSEKSDVTPQNTRKRTPKAGSSGRSSTERSSGNSQTKKLTKTIAMTSLHTEEQKVVRSVIKKLGSMFMLSESVDDNTTHVVCGDNRRTVKVLMAIARGCWLVSLDWVKRSQKANHWLDEENFEQCDLFPVAKICRLERASVGPNYRQDLFSSVGNIYVAQRTAPPQKDLEQLITLCNGHVTSNLRNVDICVGKFSKKASFSVSEQWVLDSIMQHKSLPLKDYALRRS